MKICFTSTTLNNLDKASVLATSLRDFHPELTLCLLVCDNKVALEEYPEIFAEFDRVFFAEDLIDDNLENLINLGDIQKINAIATSKLLRKFSEDKAHSVIYLDVFIGIFSNLNPLFELLEHYSVLLPAHTLTIEESTNDISDIDPVKDSAHTLGCYAILGSHLENVADSLAANSHIEIRLANEVKEYLSDAVWIDALLTNSLTSHTLLEPQYQTKFSKYLPSLSTNASGEILVDGQKLTFFNFIGYGTVESMSKNCVTKDAIYYELCCWFEHTYSSIDITRLCKQSWWANYLSTNRQLESRDVRTRYGLVKTFSKKDLISNALLEYRQWSIMETQFLSQLIEDTHSIFDIGAYLGTFSLGLKHFKSFGKTVAVEANPNAYQLLNYNLHQNIGDSAVAVNALVGRESKKQTTKNVVFPKDNLGELSFTQNELESQCSTIHVDALTLKDLRLTYGHYNLLKLDIEGMELDALTSDAQWIKENHPSIWLECNEDIKCLANLEFLHWASYDTYYFAYPAYDPTLLAQDGRQLHAYSFEAGLLAVPQGATLTLLPELADKGCFLERINSEDDLRSAFWITPRYSKAEWLDKSKYQLAALHARNVAGQSFDNFLKK